MPRRIPAASLSADASVTGRRVTAPATESKAQNAPLDRHSAEPLYKQLASRLLRLVESGELATGERLPSEPQLMQRHGVSRVTVRQAVALLTRTGKLSAHRGKGTFVAGRVVRHDLDALQGFYASLRSQGIEPQTQLLEWSVDAGAFDAQRPEGTDLPVRLQRLYSVDERPFALVTGYLPAAAAPLGRKRAEHLTVYEILSEFMGLGVTRAAVAIRCERAPAAVARALQLGRADTVLVMERRSFASAHDGGHSPCEFMRIHIVPERYEFRLQVSGPLEIASGVRKVTHSVAVNDKERDRR